MNYYGAVWSFHSLAHYGIKGQKWGIRRYQNEDGSLTDLGKARVAKAGMYKEPSFKGKDRKNRKNRQNVADEYNDIWWSRHDEMYDRPHQPSKANMQQRH